MFLGPWIVPSSEKSRHNAMFGLIYATSEATCFNSALYIQNTYLLLAWLGKDAQSEVMAARAAWRVKELDGVFIHSLGACAGRMNMCYRFTATTSKLSPPKVKSKGFQHKKNIHGK